MAESIGRKSRATWLGRLAPWLLLGGLVAFHTVNNWVWLTDNVTSTGWDKPRHLAKSLEYDDLLSAVSLRSLFETMINDAVRPPLFFASASIMYRLFGRSDDVGTMVNILYLVVALAATYGLGRRWGGSRLAWVATALLACFPMFYVMARYFYVEFALTAMVALTLYLLAASEGFRRRGFSLLVGLSLAMGLLTKRTYPVFAIGPVITAIVAAGLVPLAWQRLRQRPRIYWKKALLAAGGGLALAALWFLPNRQAVQTLVLGNALFPIWAALATVTLYFLTLPSAPLANATAAFSLGAGLASTWYLARVEFLKRVAVYGYGIGDPRGRALQLDQLSTYLYYVRKLVNEHISLVLSIVLGAALLVAVAVSVRRQGSIRKALLAAWGGPLEGWLALSCAAGAYLLLTLSIYEETRAFTPALPALALILGAAVLKLPWRPVRWGVLAFVLAFGLLQFLQVSYETVNRLIPARTLTLPLLGRVTSFAQGVYIQLPDEEETDRGYWIEPDILNRMEQRRVALGRESLSLGLLVNTSQINAGPLNLLILTQFPDIQVESLIQRFNETSPYSRLFAHDYVALKRVNAGMNPVQKQVIADILSDPPALWTQAFELETSYLLPDGDTVYLYRQRAPLPADFPAQYVTGLAEQLSSRTRQGDAILVAQPQLLAPLVAHYAGPAELYLAPTAESNLDIAANHQRIFLVLGDPKAGESQSWAEDWLNEHAFRAEHQWLDSLQLVTYGTASQPPATLGEGSQAVETRAGLGDEIELEGFDLPAGPWAPGDIVPLTLFWQCRTSPGEDYTVFVHLLDGSGQPVAQTDSWPVGGSRPTSRCQPGEKVVDRHGLLLPDTLSPGQYGLRVGMYLAATGERLPTTDAAGQDLGDSIELGRLQVISP